MLDALYVLLTIGLFVVGILYIYGCEWFIKDDTTNNASRDETFEKLREDKNQGQPV